MCRFLPSFKVLNDIKVFLEDSISLELGTNIKKPANFFDDAYEPFLWMKVSVYLYIIGVKVSEQNCAKAAAACRNSCRIAIDKMLVNDRIYLYNVTCQY